MDRDLALRLLRAVLQRGHTLDDALARLPAADARDRASAHRLAASVLRRWGTLNAVLEPFLRRAPDETVMIILCLGAAQLLLLDTPAHAAVATSVDLARRHGFAHQAGLVNAVLRRVAEGGAALLAELDSPRLDTPPWLWAAWGPRARAIATAHQHEAPIDLTLKPGAAGPAEGERRPSGSRRLAPGTRVTELEGFATGDFWVQDEAASLPARLLQPKAGERIADLCAAPGGKTAQLAAAGALVTAIEKDPARLARLEENLARLGLTVSCIAADASTYVPDALFDAVLLDAPCSATGTIRRHPDVPHIKRATDLAVLATTQRALLAQAARMLRPGGRLVYAVCSLQPEEGEAVARSAAEDASLGLIASPITADDLPFLPEAITASGALRTDPAMGMDGFFAARFVKSAG